ncbi:lactate utilization protein [Salinispirillum sp. LH 10-3-1]|uniref:Lactate utilization protein n=1 Tax=Salinispirillum sp. LH 10-3-1 TaxID=2952525 RepID=A0AB38YGY9_9GAMM
MNARTAILERLRQASPTQPVERPDFAVLERRQWSAEERVELFQRMIESVHGEVRRTANADWLATLHEWLREIGIGNLLAPQSTTLGDELRANWPSDAPKLVSYDRPIEEWQPELFNNVDAAITSTLGGIAETGSLILWPTPQEPRLMSLVPPIHIAVLDANQLHSTFLDVLRCPQWQAGLPTNALLISGPSKTADIEQTLAYGVHGPARLLVLIRS